MLKWVFWSTFVQEELTRGITGVQKVWSPDALHSHTSESLKVLLLLLAQESCSFLSTKR